MAIAEILNKFILQKSVDYELISHPHTGSSHETALASHVREDNIAKAVIVRDFSGYAMVVVPASNHVVLKHVCRELDRELELVDEDELAGLFADCETGAIPPIGLAYDIETFLDDKLTTLADVYFESGDHENLVHVSGDSFNHLLSGVRRGHFGHGS